MAEGKLRAAKSSGDRLAEAAQLRAAGPLPEGEKTLRAILADSGTAGMPRPVAAPVRLDGEYLDRGPGSAPQR